MPKEEVYYCDKKDCEAKIPTSLLANDKVPFIGVGGYIGKINGTQYHFDEFYLCPVHMEEFRNQYLTNKLR